MSVLICAVISCFVGTVVVLLVIFITSKDCLLINWDRLMITDLQVDIFLAGVVAELI